MSKFFFHLSAPDESFRRDEIGYDLIDLAAAHIRAKQFARRVMSFPSLMKCETDWRRWLVKVTDASQRPVLTLVFPTHLVSEEWRGDAQMNGVDALQRDLRSIWKEPHHSAQHRRSNSVFAHASQAEARAGFAMNSIVPCWSNSVARFAFTGRLK
jgi:hypothetical protein